MAKTEHKIGKCFTFTLFANLTHSDSFVAVHLPHIALLHETKLAAFVLRAVFCCLTLFTLFGFSPFSQKWRQGYQTHLYIYGDHTFIGDRAQGYSQWYFTQYLYFISILLSMSILFHYQINVSTYFKKFYIFGFEPAQLMSFGIKRNSGPRQCSQFN